MMVEAEGNVDNGFDENEKNYKKNASGTNEPVKGCDPSVINAEQPPKKRKQ